MDLDNVPAWIPVVLGGPATFGLWVAVRELIKLLSRRQDLTFAAGGNHEQKLWAYVQSLEARLIIMDREHKDEIEALRGRLDKEETYSRYQAIQLARVAGAYESVAGRPFQFDAPPDGYPYPTPNIRPAL